MHCLKDNNSYDKETSNDIIGIISDESEGSDINNMFEDNSMIVVPEVYFSNKIDFSYEDIMAEIKLKRHPAFLLYKKYPLNYELQKYRGCEKMFRCHLACLTVSLWGFFINMDKIIVAMANIKINKKIRP
jgi:hypothetical protein